jgi:hypothetical protein
MQESTGWTWEATATLIQAVATVVALTGVGVTFYFSYRAEKRERVRVQAESARTRLEAERADAAAERSERAAALSIDTMERIAEAIENVGRGRFAVATVGAAAEHPRVRWSLRHFENDAYLLENVGTATAQDVTISAHESLRLYGLPQREPGPVSAPSVGPDAVVNFMASASYGTRDTTITVQWRDNEAGEMHTWKYPLPPKS